MAKSTVAVRFTGDASDLKRTMGGLDDGFRKVGKVGLVAAGGIAAVGAGAFAAGSMVLDLGGQLTSFRQKTSTVFEGSAKDVRLWADTNNEAFGLGEEQLAGLAASFGDLLKPMGFTAAQAADMSTDVVGLSGALSEWSGGQRTAAEVSEILAKAMLGERDSLKELGISITEADVDARLAAKGQDELTGAALEQAKAIATQELIMEKSTDAQKAYAAGGNEAIRSQNKLKATFEDVKAQVVTALLPAVTALATWLGENLPGFIARAQVAFQRISVVVQEIAAVVRQYWPQIKESVVSAVTAIWNGVKPIVEALQALWQNFGNNILEFVQRVWPAIRLTIEGALTIIRGIIQTVTSLIRGDWSGVWNGIKAIVNGAWQMIQGIVRTALEAVRGILGVGLEIIGSIFKSAWNGLTSWFGELPGKMGRVASSIWQALKSGLSAAIRWIGEQLDKMLGPIDEIAGKVGGIVGSLGGAAGKMFGGIFDEGGIVPGPRGAPRMILAHGGETVLPTHKSRPLAGGPGVLYGSSGGTTNIYVTVTGSVLSERELVGVINRAVGKGTR